MPQTLPIARLIQVQVNLTPLAAQFASFSSLLIIGDSNVVNVDQRIIGPFASTDLTSIAGMFGTTAPEYLAAQLYFSQTPKPANLYFGRWASSATHGLLVCGIQSPTELPLANWTTITNGGFHIQTDANAAVNIAGLNFSAATNLNGVASIISAALTADGVAATCTWNGTQFVFQSNTIGAASDVGFLTPPAAGVDISSMLLGTAATAQASVDGIAVETPLTAVTVLDGVSSWYGCMFASTVPLVTADHLAVAGFIEAGGSRDHIYGVTTQDATNVWNPAISTDVGSQLAAADFLHTFCFFSEFNPYAAAGVFGVAFSANFAAANAAYTLLYKPIFGLTQENIGSTVAGTMDTKRVMYQAAYDNGRAFIGFGEMSGLAFFDEIHGTDWLGNAVQTNVFNTLFQARKIPQTDPGEQLLALAAEVAGAQGVTNGLLAAGQWNAAGFGALNEGDNLPKGYYVFIAPVATQAQADREARKSNPILMAVKLAGAVHTADVIISVNR